MLSKYMQFVTIPHLTEDTWIVIKFAGLHVLYHHFHIDSSFSYCSLWTCILWYRSQILALYLF